MKDFWREILLSLVMALVLPGILLEWPVQREERPETEFRPIEPSRGINRVRLTMKLRREDGTVEQMDMDEYLVGVVLAEMPSTFDVEAKKAQAVAARTFARKAWVNGGKHGDGSVCESSGCCQAWLPTEKYLELGGSDWAIREARAAVQATAGYVLTYEGELIEATYFSCSGGSTEDAVAVWGTDYPYLRAVDSPGEEGAAHHSDTVSYPKEVLEAKLGIKLNGDWLGETTFTAGGGVDTIAIGSKTFSGKELRSLLSLRSTAFTLEEEGEQIHFVTKGFGHRVGMSQYGADAMAQNGSTWKEILNYYYGGTTLELTNGEE